MPDSLIRSPVYRLVPSHYPPIQLFENLLEPEELEIAYELESLTNPRIRELVGDIALVAPEERVVGLGSSPIMAAFTHIGNPGRFNDASFGVYYAGLTKRTALRESSHSRARFFSATHEEPCKITMRCYRSEIMESLQDVRSAKFDYLHSPDDWSGGQRFAQQQRHSGSWGLRYRSVRHPGGECVAVFRPKALKVPTVQCGHYEYQWDGIEISAIFKIRQIDL